MLSILVKYLLYWIDTENINDIWSFDKYKYYTYTYTHKYKCICMKIFSKFLRRYT